MEKTLKKADEFYINGVFSRSLDLYEKVIRKRFRCYPKQLVKFTRCHRNKDREEGGFSKVPVKKKHDLNTTQSHAKLDQGLNETKRNHNLFNVKPVTKVIPFFHYYRIKKQNHQSVKSLRM
jgi:hypothetical protein